MKAIVILVSLISSACWSQETVVSIDSIVRTHLLPGNNYVRMTQEFRENGKLKKEMYDDWNGNRIYLRYSGKRRHMKYRYNVKWVRNSMPLKLDVE